jgi:hypothetical protein
MGKTREPQKLALPNAPKCVISSFSRERSGKARDVTRYRLARRITHDRAHVHRTPPTPSARFELATKATMSSAAFASTSRLSHTARIGSSRHTDAPLRSFRSSGVAARHGRRATRVVAAVAEPGTVAAPLTKEDLVDYLRSGCKPKEQWRCVRGAVDPRPTTWPRAFPPPPKPLARRVSSREFPETRPSRPFLEQIKPRNTLFLVAVRRRVVGGTRRPASVALFVALFDRSARG